MYNNLKDYKQSKEYEALNLIWKGITREQKKLLYDDFKKLNDFIKFHYSISECLTADEVIFNRSYEYLNDLSEDAQNLIRTLIDEGEKNLYHSIMAFISYNYNVSNANELYNLYYERFKKTRPYISVYKEQIIEIMGLCLQRWYKRNK